VSAAEKLLYLGNLGAAPLDFTLAIYFVGAAFGGHL
jgi:hypothetical protein